MKMGMKLIDDSFEMSGIEEEEVEESGKFDKWLEDKFGDKLMPFLMGISGVLGMLLAIGLFVFLPVFIVSFFPSINPRIKGVWEGIVKMIIFFLYLFLISKNKEISRILAYHGAEHKTINCYEKGLPLTYENVKEQSRLHKRCGTSFMFLVMIISMLMFVFVQVEATQLRFLIKLMFIPIVAGVSYEVLQWAGRSDALFVKIISYPGLMSQKLTTKEPDEGQIEVAIDALTKVIEADTIES